MPPFDGGTTVPELCGERRIYAWRHEQVEEDQSALFVAQDQLGESVSGVVVQGLVAVDGNGQAQQLAYFGIADVRFQCSSRSCDRLQPQERISIVIERRRRRPRIVRSERDPFVQDEFVDLACRKSVRSLGDGIQDSVQPGEGHGAHPIVARPEVVKWTRLLMRDRWTALPIGVEGGCRTVDARRSPSAGTVRSPSSLRNVLRDGVRDGSRSLTRKSARVTVVSDCTHTGLRPLAEATPIAED